MNRKLFAVLMLILAVLLIISYLKDRNTPTVTEQTIQTAKQEVKQATLAAAPLKTAYKKTLAENIQREQEVAENAVIEEDTLPVPDVVFDFCNLVDRAREYNDRIRRQHSDGSH